MTLDKRQRRHNRIEAALWLGGMIAGLIVAALLVSGSATGGTTTSVHYKTILEPLDEMGLFLLYQEV